MYERERRKALRRAKRKAKGYRKLRIQRLLRGGYIQSAEDVPEDAIPAILREQNRKSGWDRPRRWYRDKEFHCKDCGVEQTWTALEQLHYYEIRKGPVLNEPSRCAPCRRKHWEFSCLHTERMKQAAARRRQRQRGRLGPLRKSRGS